MPISSSAPFSVLLLLLTFGLIARLTRLSVDDSLTQPTRDRILARSLPGGTFVTTESDPLSKRPTKQAWQENTKTRVHKLYGFLSKVLDCSWCASIWISAEVFTALQLAQHHGGGALTAYWYVAAAGTASYVAGVVSTWLYSLDV